MKKFADLIIRGKYFVFALFAALLVLSIFFIPKITINYNLSDYLSDSTDTKIALDIMEQEFGLTGNVQVMLSGIDEEGAKNIAERLAEIDNVRNVTFDVNDDSYFKDGYALYIVLFDGDDYSESAAQVISDIKEAVEDYKLELGGTAAGKQVQKAAITKQIPFILVICICIAYIILIINTHSWLEPLLFLLTAGVAVFINLGTNIIFGSISYITNSIAAILQLALAMDYSIMLLHSYHKNREINPDNKQAMSASIAECMKPVSASALTTIAGLLALLFMSFTIGFDIGMVLMKGIVVSALVSFTLFPCIILLFGKLLDKTRIRFHKKGKVKEKPVRLHLLAGIAKKANLIIVPLVVVLLVGAAFVQTGNVYTFSDSSDGNSAITDVFGNSNTIVLIYKSGEGTAEKQQDFIDSVASYRRSDGTAALVGYTAYTNTLLEEYDADMLAASMEMPSDQARQLLTLYRLSENPGLSRMTMINFLNYTLDLVENEPEVSGMLSEDTVRTLYILKAVIEIMNTENTADEFYEKLTSGVMEGFADVSKSSIDTLYQMYYNDNDVEESSPVTGHILVEYGVNNKLIAILNSHENLVKMNAVYQTFSDDAEYNYTEVAKNLNALAKPNMSSKESITVSADLVSGVFVLKLIGEDYIPEPVVARDLLLFVEENMQTHVLLSDKVSDAQRTKISAALAAERLFLSENYTRVLLNVNVPNDGEEAYAFAEYVNALVHEIFGEDGHVAGEMMSINDLKQSFAHDQTLINIFTIVSIFLIVLLIFRSLSIPVLLVAVIQGAIWIFLSVFALASSKIFFMSYIVTSCILMGATIDYGILLSSNYVALRKTMNKTDALASSVTLAMPTILSSGSVLMCCGFVISLISTQNSIATVGLLLGVGTISSVLMILFALPSFLYLCDKIVMKTTWTSRKKRNKIDNKQSL